MTEDDKMATAAKSGPAGKSATDGKGAPKGEAAGSKRPDEWTLFEVFVRPRRGLSHNHVGSVHAPDAHLALTNARDLYTRRQEGVSIWVIPSHEITASSPDEKDSFFEPAADKIYRHPTFYDVPEGVQM